MTLPLLLLTTALAAEPTSLPRADNPRASESPAEGPLVGTLEVEAMQPAEVLLGGVKLAQLWVPGEVSFTVPAGDHLLRVYMQGKPHDLRVRIPPDGEVEVLAGRTGLSASEDTDEESEEAGIVSVEFRVMGARGATLRLGDAKHRVQPGTPLALQLGPGAHVLSVRSSDGTVIWASGVLSVSGTEPVVVHVTEGRLPEVSGGGRFLTGNG